MEGRDLPDSMDEPAAEQPEMSVTHVLLIEDNPGDARLIEVLLEEAGAGFALEWVPTLTDGLRRLEATDGRLDAVLLDLALPDSSGLETFTSVRAVAPYVPVIVLTGQDDAKLAVHAVREGAQDYLLKGGVDGALLTRSVRYAIERKRAQEQLRAASLYARSLLEASLDPLVTISAEGKITDVNAATEQVTGVSRQELIGTDFSDYFTEPEQARAGYRQVLPRASCVTTRSPSATPPAPSPTCSTTLASIALRAVA